ncbi:MAG: nucleotidyltransferase [Bacilli bacterium]
MSIGIIAEYNPFHNGHLYHLNKIKEMYPNDTIILVTNSYFSQRGNISILNKWDKTNIALNLGIDLVVELPFVFASQSADIFARGSIEILNALKVDKLIFGSETNDIELLKKIADIDLNTPLVKTYLNKGLSYPDSISKIIMSNTNFKLENPNDILAVSYIREIKRLNSNISPICIKRTNDYHSLKLSNICSASSIRKALKDKKNISNYIPQIITPYLNEVHFIDEYFHILKYKILTDNINKYQTVDEGIEHRFKKYILESTNIENFIQKVKTKRYTYNKISRMIIHILCGFTKEEAKELKTEYIRILGFNEKGQKYLKKIKKDITIPLISKYKKFKNLEIEIRSTYAYTSILSSEIQRNLINLEYKNNPKK